MTKRKDCDCDECADTRNLNMLLLDLDAVVRKHVTTFGDADWFDRATSAKGDMLRAINRYVGQLTERTT